ncbi:MAG: hypothetical protein Q9165_007993 [Trypethelium subeluteriae]
MASDTIQGTQKLLPSQLNMEANGESFCPDNDLPNQLARDQKPAANTAAQALEQMQQRVTQTEDKIRETESLLVRQIKELEKLRIEEVEYQMREREDYDEELETRIENVEESISEINTSISYVRDLAEYLKDCVEEVDMRSRRRLEANAFNTVALVQNSHLTHQEQKLAPLRSPITNTPIPGFPEKVGDIANLDDAQLTSLLSTLEEDTAIGQGPKQDRFRAAIGLARIMPWERA